MISLGALAAALVLLGILFLSNTTGNNASVDDTPNNEVTASEANNASSSATITITMTGAPSE